MSDPSAPPPGPWGPPPPPGQWQGPPQQQGQWQGPPPQQWGGYQQGWAPRPPVALALRGLSIAITVLCGVTMLVAAIAAFLFNGLADALEADESLSERLDAANGAFAALSWLGVAALAVTVCWIIWQYRHARNAELFHRGGLGPAWAIAGWFVPLANLVLPPLQLGQAASAPGKAGSGAKAGALVAAVVAWWLLLVVATTSILVGIGTAVPEDFDSASDSDISVFIGSEVDPGGYRAVAVGAGIAVVAAAAAGTVIRLCSERQQDAIEAHRPAPTGAGGYPPPGAMGPPGSGGAPPGPPGGGGGPPPPGWGPPPPGR